MAWVASTVALTALSFYAPITFTLTSLTLSVVNVVYFNRAVHEWEEEKHGTVKNWMTLAYLISSAIIGAVILRGLGSLPMGLHALKMMRLNSAIRNLMWFTGVIGFGVPALQHTYDRGLSLLKTAIWEPMKQHMSQKSAGKQKISTFQNKVQFFAGIFYPEVLVDYLPSAIETSSIPFFTKELKFDYLKKLLAECQMIASYPQPEQNFNLISRWPSVLSCYNGLTRVNQIKYQPDLFRFFGNGNVFSNEDLIKQLPAELIQSYQNQKTELIRSLRDSSLNFQRRHNELISCINKIQDLQQDEQAQKLVQASAGLTELRNDVSHSIQCVQHFLTAQEQQVESEAIGLIKKLQVELHTGQGVIKLLKLNAKKASAEEGLDRDDATWNYFLMNYVGAGENFARQAGQQFLNKLCEKLKLEDVGALDSALDKMGIGTIGAFVDHVLNGDVLVLKNREKVLAQFELFLEDPRRRVYEVLAGHEPLSLTHRTAHFMRNASYKLASLTARMSYQAAMILTAAAPIVTYPVQFKVGLGLGMVYYTIPLIQRLYDRTIGHWMFSRNYQGLVLAMRIAMERPLLNLIFGVPDHSMLVYQGAGFFSKMRILSTEFLTGYVLLNASLNYNFNHPVSGFISGIAMGHELTNLARRTWRRIWG